MNVVNNTDEPRFAAFVAIDWGDSKHAWSLQSANGGGRERGEIRSVGPCAGGTFRWPAHRRRDGTVARGSGFHAWKV
jgi:hypothetical protein